MNSASGSDSQQVILDCKRWLERAVIDLNLCPFAKSVHAKGLIRYAVSNATSTAELLNDLKAELDYLHASAPETLDTTLLIAPDCLHDFFEFNSFLSKAERMLIKLNYDGVFQIASLHPNYQFADTKFEDITNYTNRSPYPILHILREASIDRAVYAFPNAKAIYEINMETMRRIGLRGWNELDIHATATPK